MRYRVVHRTTYEYEMPVLHGQHRARVRPRETESQTVSHWRLTLDPASARVGYRRDYFGNHVISIDVLEEHEQLEVTAEFTVVTRPQALLPLESLHVPAWDECVARLDEQPELHMVQDLRFDSPLVRVHSSLREYAMVSFVPGRSLVEAVVELNERIFRDFTYDSQATDVSTPLAVVMRDRRGVCQDFAHVAVGCLRSVGLSARYVSGYLETRPPPGRPRLVGADASHAWASAYLPELGWLDFDPTNGILPGERHVSVAWGRDFSDVSPLKGVILGGGAHVVRVGVDVQPLDVEPAVASSEDYSPEPPSVSSGEPPAVALGPKPAV